MYSFANLNNTILLDIPLNNDNSMYKVFGINYLTNLICDHAMNELKRKYRPPKKYNSETPFIKRLENNYIEEQVFIREFKGQLHRYLNLHRIKNGAVHLLRFLFSQSIFLFWCDSIL